MQYLLVFTGGGLGCLLRYLIGTGFNRITSLPLSTFISNISACIIFAVTLRYLHTVNGTSTSLRLLLLTGFCGGLSTFSTFGYETFLLFRQNMHLYAILNILVSTLLCISAFFIFRNHDAG